MAFPIPLAPGQAVRGGLALVVALAAPTHVGGQVVSEPPDTTLEIPDSSDVRGGARAAQARFERRRMRYLPVTFDSYGGTCDEVVGRFCSWYDEGDWFPVAEREEIVELRAELLQQLDSAQRLLPGDGWVLGQRVWYRSEAGDWNGALRSARSCGAVERWWCLALEGFALHGLGRYDASLSSFERSLALMDPETARRWRLPRRALDSDGRGVLGDLEDAPTDSVSRVLDRLWQLADPLFLAQGNDRLTEHYARWTVSTLRERARNPFHIRWARDMEELTVRHGWELGWERSPGRFGTTMDNIVGHKHPEGRDFMPPGRALTEPASLTPEQLRADRTRPRSLYAPAYAPVLLPMESQVAVFPRGSRIEVVASTYLPEDTTYHRDHPHDMPWREPGAQSGLPDRAGLFLVGAGGGPLLGARAAGRTETTLRLEAPAGSYVVSAESWSPERRRAGRLRYGFERLPLPDDVAGLSDILMLRPGGEAPLALEAALPRVLPRTEIRPAQTFAIGWEVMGLGFRPETLRFAVSVERTDRGVLRRLGEFLRLADRPRPLEVSWEEPGPVEPGPHFGYLDLELPELDAGRYVIRLVLETAGRGAVVTERAFTVRER